MPDKIDRMVRRRAAHVVAALAALVTGGACAPEVPANPTWTEDVRPILVANCVRCHSSPSLQGAPGNVRFDKFDDEDRDGDGEIDFFGAATEAIFIAERVEAEEMPPRFPLPDRQRDTLIAWFEAGAPKGDPRPGNVAPSMELTGDPEAADDTVVIPYRIDDADFDLVTGRLIADPGDGDPIAVTYDLFSGRGEIAWDVLDVAPGTYDLSAEIDDGSDRVEVDLGSVEIVGSVEIDR